MPAYDTVIIIFNPKSTHDAEKRAKILAKQISILDPKLMPTKHAGHAIEIAYDIATKYKHPLIISVSGDGGFNEVVNGVMRAKSEKPEASPVLCVVGAGNANDQSNARDTTMDDNVAKKILSGDTKAMDALCLTYGGVKRYAHSYIGFGISADAGNAINRSDKGGVDDLINVAKSITDLKPVRVVRHGFRRSYDSMIFFNIGRMAKLNMVGNAASEQDGMVTVHLITHSGVLRRLAALIHLALPIREKTKDYRQYSFVLRHSTVVQLDGETHNIPAGSHVTINCVTRAVETVA